jgi:hypothetical protein
MVKKRLVAIFFLLFLPSVLPLTEEPLYSGTVQDGDSVSVGGFDFEFSVASEGAVLVRYDGNSVIVPESSCKYHGNLHFCVGDISWAYRNVTVWKDIYETEIDISTLKGDLQITRSIEKTRFLIGDTSKVEVLIKNSGSRKVEDIFYKDSYPSSIRIGDVDGCSLKGNTIQWRGSLGPGVKKSCSYTLIGVEGATYESKAEATYFDGVSENTAYSDKVEIEVQNYSLQIEHSLNKSRVEIGEPLEASFVVENINKDEEISVYSFKIDVPSEFKIVKKSNGLVQRGQILSWRGNLESNEQKNFTIVLLPEMMGATALNLEWQYKAGAFTRKFNDNIKVDVYCDCLMVKHYPDKIAAGEETDFMVYIFNPSSTNWFRDISVNVFTTLPGEEDISRAYTTLNPRGSIMLFNKKINVHQGLSYHYNVSIEYSSEYGQHFQTSEHILLKEGAVEESSNSVAAEDAVNATNSAKDEDAEKNNESDIGTTVVDLEGQTTWKLVIVGLIVLIAGGTALGIAKIIKRKKEEKQLSKFEGALLLSLFLIFGAFVLYGTSASSVVGITGLGVYGGGSNLVDKFSILGAMAVLFGFLLAVIYKKNVL